MATPLEELEIRLVRDVVLASMRGEVDLSNAPSVRQRLLAAIPNAAAALVLDLSGTDYLDSSGLALIFELSERLAARGQRIALVVPEGSVIKRVLVLTGVEHVAPMLPSVEAALRAAGADLEEQATGT
jgi:anti-sigma B factor antagonist